jgi:hypothetical protein
MPALFAGGVCCAVLVFEDETGLLAGGVAGGLLAGAADSLLAAGAGVDLLAGAELAAGTAAGVAAVESVAVAFFELLLLVGGAAPSVSVVLFFRAELSAAPAEVLFFDRDVLVLGAVSDPLVFAAESAIAVLLSAASEVALFFERDFLVVVAESPDPVELSAASAVALFLERDCFVVVAAELSDADASVLAAAFSLDLEVVDFAESAVASVL